MPNSQAPVIVYHVHNAAERDALIWQKAHIEPGQRLVMLDPLQSNYAKAEYVLRGHDWICVQLKANMPALLAVPALDPLLLEKAQEVISRAISLNFQKTQNARKAEMANAWLRHAAKWARAQKLYELNHWLANLADCQIDEN